MTGNTVNSLMIYYKNNSADIKKVMDNIKFFEE
jgi:hypothetical protein